MPFISEKHQIIHNSHCCQTHNYEQQTIIFFKKILRITVIYGIISVIVYKVSERIVFMLFTREIGIDLGTANTLVYMKGHGIIMREPSVVAVDNRTEQPRYVGQEAKDIIGRTPGAITALRPLKDGVIADFEATTVMLDEFIKKALKGSLFFVRANVVICIPSGVTAVERRAVKEAAENAGARRVSIIEEPMAAAIGAGLPVAEPIGSMIVDIGGGTSEVAVISLRGIVTSRSVRIAGDAFDSAITLYIRKKYNLLIGERTAENVKIEIGSAFPLEKELTMDIKGRNLLNGLPENVTISSEEIREALSEPLSHIIEAIKSTLEKTPPELSADIIDNGIMLAGGGALIRGLDELVSHETGMPVHVAKNPLDCVAAGAGKVLEDLDNLHDVLSDES